MADPSKPDEPPQEPESERPRESFTDGDRDFPMPHESRSFITGAKRKVSILSVPPETLPTAPKAAEPKPPKTDAESTPQPYGQSDAEIEKEYREDPAMVRLREDTDRRVKIAASVLMSALNPRPSPPERDTKSEPPKSAESEPPADSATTSPKADQPTPVKRPVPPQTEEDRATLRELAKEVARQKIDLSAVLRARRDPAPDDSHSLASIIMNGFPEHRRREEQEHLRKLEELTERQEKLQQAASEREAINDSRRILAATREQPSAPKDTIDWDQVSPPIPEKRKSKIDKSSLLSRLAAHPTVRVSGCLAIAGFALGTQLSGAPKIAAFFYFVSWVLCCLVIYFSLWRKTRVGSILIASALAIAIGGFWWVLLPSPSERQPTAQEIADEVWRRNPLSKAPTANTLTLRDKGKVVFADFPQPFMYEYGAPTSFLAPVGLAINIEVTNNKPTKTRINQYFADIRTADGEWHRVLSLPMYPPRTLYFLNRRDITRGMRCNFEPAIFDVIANNKNLDPGETLEGWVFFEWPVELRQTTVEVKAVRWTVKNSQDEITEAIFEHDTEAAQVSGASQVNEGGVFCTGTPGERIDLSSIPIKPLRDK